MRVEMKPNNRPIEHFNDIVDAELTMYDEVMLSTISCPSFKVYISFPHLSIANHPHMLCWNTIKEYINQQIDVKVTLFDNNDQTIAQGYLHEYNENYADFKLEVTCKNEVADYLDETIKISNHNFVYGYDSEHSRLGYINALRQVFYSIWNYRMNIPCYIDPADNEKIFGCLADVLMNNNYWQYPQLRITVNFDGSRKAFLKQLSQMCYSKIIYDTINKRFHLIPFEKYEENPVVVAGYVISENYNITEQSTDEITFIDEVMSRNLRNQNSKCKGDFVRAIKARLKEIIKYKSYDIWGYALPSQILYTGQTIRLNNTDYYIKDISYETKTLDSLKSFKTECVRFL